MFEYEKLARPQSIYPGTKLYERIVSSPHWVAQEKVDGWRCLVRKEGDRVWFTSRHGKDVSREVDRDVAKEIIGMKHDFELDTELEGGELHLFDLLSWHGVDMRDVPLSKRLITLMNKFPLEMVVTSAVIDKERAYSAWIQRGAEGMVLKKLDAAYPPINGAVWLKVRV